MRPAGGRDAAIGSVALKLAGLDVVGQDDAQDAVEEPALELGVFDREHDFDAPAEVSRHPVGRGQEDLRLVAVLEVGDPRMLEVFVDDADHPDVVRDARHARAQAAGSADDQIDPNAGLRGPVEQSR